MRIVTGSESEVGARVQGARDYYVDITCEDDELNMWCDCPYFDSTGPCKHLWATILAAEAKGYLGAASRFDRKSVVYDYGDDEIAEDLAEDEDTEDYEPALPIGSYKPAPVVPFAKPQPKPPGWHTPTAQMARTHGFPSGLQSASI